MPDKVLCIGEILWDIYPDKKYLGGAPFNVAFMLNKLGLNAKLLSAIGDDDLGIEILGFLKSNNFPIDLIKEVDHPTGRVEIKLDGIGKPSYSILDNMAYDFIPHDPIDKFQFEVLVYGTLAFRHESNFVVLQNLTREAELNILDLNLRAPFYSAKSLNRLISICDILKINDEELLEINNLLFGLNLSEKQLCQTILKRYDIQSILLTKGKDGVSLYQHNKEFHCDAVEIKPIDTVGAGDSFLAAFIYAILQDKSELESRIFS